MLSFLLLISLVVSSLSYQESNERAKLDELGRFFVNKRKQMSSKTNMNKLKKNKKDITSFKPDNVIININDPIDVQYDAFCSNSQYVEQYTNVYNFFNGILVGKGLSSYVNEMLLDWFTNYVAEPYKSEMTHFANCTSVPLEGVILVNLRELFKGGCTSIVAADKNNKIVHGKNTDLNLGEIADDVRDLSINVIYKSDNTLLFKGASWFGFSGIHSGVKPNGFSISSNTRYSGNMSANFQALQNGYYPQVWLIRDTLLNSNNYNHALNQLITTHLLTPCYFVIGGLNYPEGAVVSRHYTQSINLWTLNNSWFLVETNYDWWLPVTNAWDDRRSPAIQNMNIITKQKMSTNNLYTVLSQTPNMNAATMGITVMSASAPSIYRSKKLYRSMVVKLIVADHDEDVAEGIADFVFLDGEDDELVVNEKHNWWHSKHNWWFFIVSILLNIMMCGWILYGKIYGKNSRHQLIKTLELESDESENETEVPLQAI
eukprot:450866_1